MASSIAAATSQVVPMMLEKVNPLLPDFLVEEESKFSKLFNKAAPKHNISAWTAGSGAVLGYRIPVLLFKGGDYQAISLDGGDLGAGSMPITAYMTIGTYESDIGYQLPLRTLMATKGKDQAIKNALKMTLGSAIEEMALYNEIGLFQDSTGLLAQATANGAVSGGKVTYTLETSFAWNRIRGNNQLVDIYDGSNVLQVSGARVNNISFAANQITLSGVPANASWANGTGPHSTDQIAFPNMGTGTFTTAAGSWRNGIYVFNTTSTAGSLLGLSYASAYELACNTVNLASGFYTTSAIFSGKSQLMQRRDDKAFSKTIAVCHNAQRFSWYIQGITIANQYVRPGESLKSIDLAGQDSKYGDTFEAGDVTHHVSRYASKTRIDWLIPSNFGWVQFDDIGFIQTPEGQRMFIGHSTTTGNPTAGVQFYAHNTRNLYCVDPGASVVFYSGAIPAGQ